MKKRNTWLEQNLHLLISTFIVFPTGIIYGFPSLISQFFDIHPNSTDLLNMLKAIMCLYIGFSILWVLGMLKPQYWKKATELNALFMIMLAFGRGFSMITDGLPTNAYILGLVGELVLGSFAIYQLKKFS